MYAMRIVLVLAAGAIACFPSEPNNYKDPNGTLELIITPFVVTIPRGDSTNVQAMVYRGAGYAGSVNVVSTSLSQAITTKIRGTSTNLPNTQAVVAILTSAATPLGSYAVTVDASASGLQTVHATVAVNVVAP